MEADRGQSGEEVESPLPGALLQALREWLGLAPADEAAGTFPGDEACWYRGRRVLVTGAGGSIGSELCRQLLELRPERLILLERDEQNLFDLLRAIEPLAVARGVKLNVVLCDLRFPLRVEGVFRRHAPQVVLHTAACKQVPLLEENGSEAVSNNVGGTRVLLEACTTVGVERALLLSTDKAVNPASLMGATKRLTELMFQQCGASQGRDRYRCLRLGNVLGTRGSVAPVFREQILSGGPLTLTDARMTRYFIALREAGRRILRAAAVDSAAGLLVAEMGEAVPVIALARAMIQLLAPREAIEIRTVGRRAGERLQERLWLPEETVTGRVAEGLLGVRETELPDELGLGELEHAATAGDEEAVRSLLRQLPLGYGAGAPPAAVASLLAGE